MKIGSKVTFKTMGRNSASLTGTIENVVETARGQWVHIRVGDRVYKTRPGLVAA